MSKPINPIPPDDDDDFDILIFINYCVKVIDNMVYAQSDCNRLCRIYNIVSGNCARGRQGCIAPAGTSHATAHAMQAIAHSPTLESVE